MYKFVDVYIEHSHLSLNQAFTYRCPFEVQVGCRVKVPFGRQTCVAFVQRIKDTSDVQDVKDVLEVMDKIPLLNQENMELADYMSDTYVCSKISCIKAMLPPALKPSTKAKAIVYENWAYKAKSTHPLTDYQKEVYQSITFPLKASEFRKQAKSIAKKLIDYGYVELVKKEKQTQTIAPQSKDDVPSLTHEQAGAISTITNSTDSIFLLHGVTGSGKTEVFLQLASKYIQEGKQVLFLVPEIGLTPMMIQRVTSRFGASIAIYHSHLNAQEKYNQYQLVRDNKVQIVVGTRSAIFLPFENLGLILMDEEHDASYKQDNVPRYHTLDIVKWRANYHSCKVILSSATPSLESYARATKGIYHLVELTKRIYVNMPQIRLIDMKNEKTTHSLSLTLIHEMNQALKQNEQVILLLNRRGYLPVVRCKECNTVLTCPDCGIALTYHKKDDYLMCHCCGRLFHFDHTCPQCHSHQFHQSSMGTERLEENLHSIFPDAHVVRMDTDNTRRKNAHATLLKEFETKGDILVGTQMVAKGLDFPRVTLVGILNADATLTRMDYRSNELGYQLIEQASGRSGRGKTQGQVLIQTFDPEHYVMQHVIHHNYKGFFRKEMQYRHMGSYPPYVYMCMVIYSHKDQTKAMEVAQDAKQFLQDCKVLGPVSISKRKNKERVRLIIKSKDMKQLNACVWDLSEYHQSQSTNVTQEINMWPLSLEE